MTRQQGMARAALREALPWLVEAERHSYHLDFETKGPEGERPVAVAVQAALDSAKLAIRLITENSERAKS